jgi:hypothetical protein
LSAVNVAETILVFVGIPLAVVVGLALLIFLPGGRRRSRYRPGQPWDHAPVWYEPHPEHGPTAGHGTPGHEGQTNAIGSSVYGEPTGSDGHGTHESHAAGSHAPGSHAPGSHAPGSHAPGSHAPGSHAPVKAGPLGGARGTW